MSRLVVVGGLIASAVLTSAATWQIAADDKHLLSAAEPVLGSPEDCAAYGGLPSGWGRDPHAGMRWIAEGRVNFGSDRGYADERPVVATTVSGFWIDRTEVTNAQFETFVRATGYKTTAERGGGASVFREPPADAQVIGPQSWWRLIEQANWRHPEGSGSDINGHAQEPVVDVSYEDAQAYARWLGRDLPNELEWEFAAKADRSNEASDLALRDAQKNPAANFWQGLFPLENRQEDGYAGRAPVGCFAANPNGLHDMVGNVWEWTRDGYSEKRGVPDETAARTPSQVIKGGSYLCASNYCARARASSRQGQESDLPATHVGFRTISRS